MATRLFIIVAVHFLFLVLFPYTGKLGLSFCLISTMIWCGLMMFAHTGIKMLRLFFTPVNFVMEILLALAVALMVSTTLPQQDKVSPFNKLMRKRYPDIKTIDDGLSRFGFGLPKSLKKAAKKKGVSRILKKRIP